MGCADVCIDMDYDGSNDFYHEATRRAAKPHRCCECRREIAKGELHQVATGKSDGRIWTNRTCTECVEIRDAFCCGGWIFGELWSAIDEQVFPSWNEMTAIDCLAKLKSDAAVTLMRDRYAEYREDNDV